jgi:hypothetical protein
VIKFPNTFDTALGPKVVCKISQGLTGYIGCILQDRMVILTNFDSVTPSFETPIEIIIKGVQNPNREINSNAGTITLGIRWSNTVTFQDYTSEAGIVVPIAAPGWTSFKSLTISNTFSRYKADYTLDFRSYNAIPATTSEGFIIFNFPTQFTLDDGA